MSDEPFWEYSTDELPADHCTDRWVTPYDRIGKKNLNLCPIHGTLSCQQSYGKDSREFRCRRHVWRLVDVDRLAAVESQREALRAAFVSRVQESIGGEHGEQIIRIFDWSADEVAALKEQPR
jgi:hypothetical protein